MRAVAAIILSIACAFESFAIDPKYPVAAISDDLKKDVNVVVREDHMVFKIISQSRATLTMRFVATIMNPGGKRYAHRSVDYDNLRKVTSFKASVYNANGDLIRKAKNNEVIDESDFDGLYSDDRSKSIDLSQSTYPYTVEFEYEVEYKFLFHIPGSVFLTSEKLSLENGSYTLVYANGLKPRYYSLNINSNPVEMKTSEGLNQITWKVTNLIPIKSESFGPSIEELAPQVTAAPSRFEYDGYIGSMDNWQDFGKWVISLNNGKRDLPEATKIKAQQLTAQLKTTEEKTKTLYQYLQNKTRYVSIQLGIGGYQPFAASVVDQTGYGDCKALSNYMVALLEAVGIKSNYVLIRAGDSELPIDVNFSSSQFNHAIVAVPNGADTLWLECTSQTKPFGYMGTFTGDRKALMITDDGAKIVNTLSYYAQQNKQIRTAQVTVLPNGDASAKIKTVYSGLQYENDDLNFVVDGQYEDQKEWVQDNTDIPSFDVTSFSMQDQKEKIPSATVTLDLSLKRFAVVSGKRLFLTPNLMNRSTYIPERLDKRSTKISISLPGIDEDIIEYIIPESIYPEFLPSVVKLKSRFGDY